MDTIVLECTYTDDCTFITRRTHVPQLAFDSLDEHLQDEHDTNLEDELERLEEETGKSIEELIEQGGIDPDE